jgi:hypothetical protein
MYHDKRFQKDSHFALKRLMDVDTEVLSDLIKRMEDGERVKPETDEEKLCFQLIKDLDHVGGHVKGSTTSKSI